MIADPPLPMVANLPACLLLLRRLQRRGLGPVVLCPGSRSAPLAVAAALLEPLGLRLVQAIDERSAAFFALGLARGLGVPTAVITTSGSAVANLLPAAVEADHGAIPLLLLTADRPARLKGCGANQSVNQEHFLQASCRWCGQGDPAGLAVMEPAAIEALADRALAAALPRPAAGGMSWAPGPVHLNLPLEEPLHCTAAALQPWQGPAGLAALAALAAGPTPDAAGRNPVAEDSAGETWAAEAGAGEAGAAEDRGTSESAASGGVALAGSAPEGFALVGEVLVGEVPLPPGLDPHRPGVVVAGPWRGLAGTWPAFRAALVQWCARSGWPVLADPLSGLRGDAALPLVAGYDLLLEDPAALAPAAPPLQVLRLGPLPASRRLQRWLEQLPGQQLLITEGEPRPLDPLGRVDAQWSQGLASWLAAQPLAPSPQPTPAPAQAWQAAEQRLQGWLDAVLPLEPAPPVFREPWLARALDRLLPPDLPLLLANSSPVRDWETFASGLHRRAVHGFRGASGIDGTLSQACGLAQALGQLVLVSGDLALLHDSNGWLWRSQLRGRLTVVLVDNAGGGIFEQLPIRTDPDASLDFERLFAMPQAVDPLALAAAHGVPGRRGQRPADLAADLAWALAQPLALVQVCSERRADGAWRQRLRTMAARQCLP